MSQTRSHRKGKRFSQKGIALIVVLSFLTVLIAVSAEFSSSSTINYISAINARESMRAQFINRSGANLAQLVIRIQTDVLDKNRQFIGDIQLADYTSMFIGAFGGSRMELDDMAELYGFDEDAASRLGLAGGQFDLTITSEDGKINMNCANGSKANSDNLRAQLISLLFFEAYNPIFERQSADGWQRTRAEQVDALLDYIDKGRFVGATNSVDEESQYQYQSLDDRYRAKNNYIDEPTELKLVRGVDDRFWTLFGNQFTAYGGCKVNLASVEDPKLIAALIGSAAKNDQDPVVRDPLKLWKLAQRVAEARSFGIFFAEVKDFADYVKDPDGGLQAMLSGASGRPVDPAVSQAANGVKPVEGVELDLQKLGLVATTGPRRVYRVEVVATAGQNAQGEPRYERHLIGIWDTKVQNQNMRNPENRQGAWVYWREE